MLSGPFKGSILFIITSSFARFARSATSPSFAYVSNPVPDSSLCRAAAPPIAYASAAAPRLHRSASNCCSPFPSASAAAHRTDCVPSGAARHLRSLQLLFPDFNSSPDCVRFGCCSPIASASTAAPRLHPLVASPVLEDSSPCPMFSNVLRRVRGSVH